LKRVEREVAEQSFAGLGSASSQQSEDSEGEAGEPRSGGPLLSNLFGGVAMERDREGASVPTPPPRPASTGSTGGRSA
jgi:hypothetical protein